MANFNKVTLIGRLTRDVETRAFGNGGMVAKFGFAVNNSKKNAQTGQWEDVPMYIDCEAYNRGETGRLADTIRDRCHKGSQILIEGKLHLDSWQDKATGQNRSKHKIVVDQMVLLDPRQGGEGGGGNYTPRTNQGGGFSSPAAPQSDGPDEPGDGGESGSGNNQDIPF
jgi:single-strand DNA-binding protein